MSGFTDDELLACLPMLRRFARKLTRDADAADDLVQDTIERALGKRHLYRETSGSLQAWLGTMLYRGRVNDIRAAVRRPQTVELDLADAVQAARAENIVYLGDVVGAMAALSPDHRGLIEASAWGLSQKEQAAESGITMGTTCSRLNRARHRLEALLA